MKKLCPCGKPLHYNNPDYQQNVEKLIQQLGVDIKVDIIPGEIYLIPRHYIALHGLKANEIKQIAKKYGFQRIK